MIEGEFKASPKKAVSNGGGSSTAIKMLAGVGVFVIAGWAWFAWQMRNMDM
jgi:hypothetical protein